MMPGAALSMPIPADVLVSHFATGGMMQGQCWWTAQKCACGCSCASGWGAGGSAARSNQGQISLGSESTSENLLSRS